MQASEIVHFLIDFFSKALQFSPRYLSFLIHAMSAFVILGIANQAQAYGIFYRKGKKKAKAKVKVTLKIAEQVTEHMPETLIEFMFNLGTKLYVSSTLNTWLIFWHTKWGLGCNKMD